jgi:hypothetical protein
MHSKQHTEQAKSAKPSTAGRSLTPAEHRMKRLHDAKTQRMAEEMAAALNEAVRQGK